MEPDAERNCTEFEVTRSKSIDMKILAIVLVAVMGFSTPTLAKKVKSAAATSTTTTSTRMEAQLNTRSVNPIVISRDRALGN